MKKRNWKLALLVCCCLSLCMSVAKKCQAWVYPLESVPHHAGDIIYKMEFSDDKYLLFIDINTGDAGVEAGMMGGDELVVPDSVSYRKKTYPVTAFIRHIPYAYDPEEHECIAQKYKKLTLPDSVRTIDLHNWPDLQTINIPRDMSSILLEVKQKVHYLVPADMTNYYLRNNALYSKKESNKLFYTMNIPAKYKIDEGTECLSEGSFCNTNRYHIKEVIFPVSVKKMGDNVFSNCENLERVNMSQCQISNLGYESFAQTSQLKKISLPEKLKTMEKQVFFGSSISKITLPSKLKAIGTDAFSSCKKLKSVTLEGRKKMPAFAKESFWNTRSGIKFYVKNKKMAKQLKKNLKGTKVKKAKIYVGKKKKLVYKNING